eukprot:16198-Heterococcus_DN1.PRE.1
MRYHTGRKASLYTLQHSYVTVATASTTAKLSGCHLTITTALIVSCYIVLKQLQQLQSTAVTLILTAICISLRAVKSSGVAAVRPSTHIRCLNSAASALHSAAAATSSASLSFIACAAVTATHQH